MAPNVIRLKAVTAVTSLSRSSIYAKVRDGTFPAPIKLGPRASAWVEKEIQIWVEQRIALRDSAGRRPQ